VADFVGLSCSIEGQAWEVVCQIQFHTLTMTMFLGFGIVSVTTSILATLKNGHKYQIGIQNLFIAQCFRSQETDLPLCVSEDATVRKDLEEGDLCG
jgi:hypothetical protein